jgi:hypothetical protein
MSETDSSLFPVDEPDLSSLLHVATFGKDCLFRKNLGKHTELSISLRKDGTTLTQRSGELGAMQVSTRWPSHIAPQHQHENSEIQSPIVAS